ncbi:MAG: AAA family ATPase [Candidatus Hydrogenedentes bacterium]|nr:AAA family ATPase [Candidatus Hydrogenedentota bacterium]
MSNEPILTKIAFVVDENGLPGEEIRFVSVSLDDGQWTPPLSCRRGRDGEYWRKVFLLIARYWERLNTLGSLEYWPDEGHGPILVGEGLPDYEGWHFLAKYWKENDAKVKREPKSAERKRIREYQKALAGIFQRQTDRSPFPWITVRVSLELDTVLLCPRSIELPSKWPQKAETVPERLFEHNCIDDPAEVDRLFRELCEKVAKSERQLVYARGKNSSWMTAYKSALVSRVPEVTLAVGVREYHSKDQTNIYAQGGPSSMTAPGRILFVEDLLNFAPNVRRILLSGPSGTGKSTLARLLADQHMACTPAPTPRKTSVLVQLNLFDPGRHKHFSDLALESMCRLATEADQTFDERTESAIRHWLESDQSLASETLYLLDGYNEIPFERRLGARGFDKLFQAFLKRKHQGRIVVTARTELYPPEFVPRVFIIQEPDDDAVRQFIDARLGHARYAPFTAQLLTDPKLRSLIKNPFFLDHLIKLALQIGSRTQHVSTELPCSRAGVLKAFVEGSRDRKFRQEGLEYVSSPLSLPHVVSALSKIAHAFLVSPAHSTHYPDGIARVVPDAFEREAVIRTAVALGFLQDIDFDSTSVAQPLVFSHDLLRDYFASIEIAARLADGKACLRTDYLEYRRWDGPLSLFVELCEDQATVDNVIHEVTLDDSVFASELGASAARCGKLQLTQLLRANGYRSEYAHKLISMALEHPQHIVRLPQVSCEATTRLLATLDDWQLFRARQELPKLSWLWSNIVAAIGARGLFAPDPTAPCEADADYIECYLALEGLSNVGTSEAFERATEILRRIAPRFDASEMSYTAEQRLFVRLCSRMFSQWYGDLSPECVLDTLRQHEGFVRWALLQILHAARFSEKHIESLVREARISEVSPGSVLQAIGRIGGKNAVSAIMRVAKHFANVDGNLATSENCGLLLDAVLSALAGTGEIAMAASCLQNALLGPLSEDSSMVSTEFVPSSEEDPEYVWNTVLIGLLHIAKEPQFIIQHLFPDNVDEKAVKELRALTEHHSEFSVRHEAKKALAKVVGTHCPELILTEIEEIVEKRPEYARNCVRYICPHPGLLERLETREVDSELFRPLWGMSYMAYIRRCIGSTATVGMLDLCVRLSLNESLPVPVRTILCEVLLDYGIRPQPWLVLAFLTARSVFVQLLARDTAIQSICTSLSDNEALRLLSEMKELAENGDRTYSQFRIGQPASFILAGRERRYLHQLESWPDGLRSVPQEYQPVGYEILARIVDA